MRIADELQMQINDVHSCSGSCAGCILSVMERKSPVQSMTREIMIAAISRLEEHARSVGHVRKINVIFGIGDHLIFGSDYVAELHRLGSKVIEAGFPEDPANSVIFFTTSLVGRQESVINELNLLRSKIVGSVPLVPQVVLDGRLINAEKFAPRWRAMVMEAKRLFGRVDLVTNLSGDAVRMLPPSQLMEFAANCGFDGVAVNWSPTISNSVQTLSETEQIADWIEGFDDLLASVPEFETTYRPVLEKMLRLAPVDQPLADDISMAEIVRGVTTETMLKAFEIEPDGTVIPKFEAVGDVTHSERHGLPGIGNISEGPISELVERAARRVMARIISIHAQGACAGCRYTAACAGTGFHVGTHIGRVTGRTNVGAGCPHVAYRLFDKVSGTTTLNG